MKNLNQIFPAEIISDILSRLPTESVLESKLVCTTWKNLIQQPSFPQIHLARLNSADSGKLSYVFLDTDDNVDTQLFYFEFNENEDWMNHRRRLKPIRRKFDTRTTKLDYYVLIGSFNGLVCVYGDSHDAMIFNPMTKEYISLPEFDAKERKSAKTGYWYEHLACGFGYLTETNEYKVVRIYRKAPSKRYKNAVEVDVYTVGSGKGWRHVGNFDLGFEFGINGEDRDGYAQPQGVFTNGCLHWRNVKGGMVVVFDLAEEKFREPIPPPPMLTLTHVDEDNDEDMMLGVSNGGILYYTAGRYLQPREEEDEEDDEEENVSIEEVWLLMRKDDDNNVMRGQEEKQSWVWSKPISLEQREPFAFKEQDKVLRYDQGNIKEFSSRDSTWTNLWEFSEISRRVFPHRHTLISLRDLGEEDAKIMKRLELTIEDFRSMCDFDSDDSYY